jgi:phage terminase small subunit
MKTKGKTINIKLTAKQKMFCREYLVDLNATQAAIRAGYSAKTAKDIGCQTLAKVYISEYIQKLMDKRAAKIEITADKVLEELAKMAFANMQDYITVTDDGSAFIDLSNLTREQAAALAEVSVDSYLEGTGTDEEKKRVVKKIKIKLADKRGNLELLGKNLKLFNDRIDLNIVNRSINPKFKDDSDDQLLIQLNEKLRIEKK